MQGSLNQYMLRVVIFLFIIILISVFVYPVLQPAFLANVYINSIIVFSLIFGLFFCIYNLNELINDYKSLASFNIHKSSQNLSTQSKIIKNLLYELSEKNGRFQFKSSRVDKIIESVDMSLTSIRETSRYLVGLLVFLGLLGTFWGLLKTIGSVGNVIGGLGIDDTNVAGFFNSLKDGLTAPLDGMSIAFSSSLLGLAGSLILGFVDLQLGQAQNKFSEFTEKIVHNNSLPDFVKNKNALDPSTLNAIEKIYDNLDSLVFSLKQNVDNQSQTMNYMNSLSNQIRELTSYAREQDKKISNFLSTQLNTQSSYMQLSSELSKKGLIDKETKQILKNIDKGIKQLKLIKK